VGAAVGKGRGMEGLVLGGEGVGWGEVSEEGSGGRRGVL